MTLNYEPRTLFLDIETAPAKAYIWDLKTRYVPLSQVAEDGYVLCYAAAWEDFDEGEFASTWDHGEKQMVEWAWELLDEADVVVTYNGNGFDLPRLNSEFLKYRLGPPTPYHSIDLYQTVSRKFRVLSKSMNHMLRLLDLDEKVKHKGMELWTGCMEGVAEDQALMEEYNVGDIITLQELYNDLRPWIDNMPNFALWMEPSDEPKCRCGSTDLRFKGYKRTSVFSYKQYLCNSCGQYPRERFAEETRENRRKDILR